MLRSPAAVLLLWALSGPLARADDVEKLAKEATALLEQGRPGEALGLFEKALRLAPGEPALRRGAALAHLAIGRAGLETGDLEGAVSRFQLSLGYWQDEPELYLWLGVAYYRSGEFFAARNEFQHVLRHRPEDPTALAYVGFAYYREDRWDQAERYLGRAAARAPEDANLERWLERTRQEKRASSEYLTLSGERFTVRYPEPGDHEAARRVLDALGDAWVRVGNDLGLYPDAVLVVFVYRPTDFQRITGASPWIQGLYDGKIRLSTGDLGEDPELRRLIQHEYAHALLHRLAPGTPAWLEEGLAQLEEGHPDEAARALVRDALGRGEWIPFEELAAPFHSSQEKSRVELAYAEAFVFVHDLAARFGKGTLVRVLARSGQGTPLATAFQSETGSTLDDLVAGWRKTLE